MQPYLRGSVLAYPFDWFEASFQYTDVNNYLYSPYKEFSGGQSYKDKGFDAKFRILKESTWTPAVALGFRDLGGTGLFSSEFIVATKRIRNIDLSIGAGWGILSDNRFSNPLTRLNNSSQLGIIDLKKLREESLMLIHFSQEKVLVYLEELNILFLKEKGLDSSSNMTALIIISRVISRSFARKQV